MKQATMLYKHGGEHKIHGSNFDYVIVDAAIDGEIERHLEDGWFFNTTVKNIIWKNGIWSTENIIFSRITALYFIIFFAFYFSKLMKRNPS